MEKIHGNMHVFVLSCKFVMCKHINIMFPCIFLKVYLN